MLRFIRLVSIITLMWFVPWVLMLNIGLVIYRPYEANGIDRFYRLAGPVPQLIIDTGWIDSAQIPSICKRALVASEDINFYEHLGIDPDSIEIALRRNEKRGKLKWGGSTITQQLVKNVFLSRDKTYLRKAREATGALLLDLAMNKDDQMTWYFNVVEFGPRIYGLKQASQHYFKRNPNQLSAQQCVQLVSILPAPKRYHRAIKNGRPTDYLLRRINSIRSRLQQVQLVQNS